MKIHFVLTPEDYAENAAKIEPLIRKSVDNSVHGEFTTADCLRDIKTGNAYCGFVEDDDGSPMICFVWCIEHYARMNIANVYVLGGKGFAKGMAKYGEKMFEVFRRQGADCIEADCSPAMARMHKHYGFKEIYRKVRLPLASSNKENANA